MGLNGTFLSFDKHTVILNGKCLQSILLDILAIIKAMLAIWHTLYNITSRLISNKCCFLFCLLGTKVSCDVRNILSCFIRFIDFLWDELLDLRIYRFFLFKQFFLLETLRALSSKCPHANGMIFKILMYCFQSFTFLLYKRIFESCFCNE